MADENKWQQSEANKAGQIAKYTASCDVQHVLLYYFKDESETYTTNKSTN